MLHDKNQRDMLEIKKKMQLMRMTGSPTSTQWNF